MFTVKRITSIEELHLTKLNEAWRDNDSTGDYDEAAVRAMLADKTCFILAAFDEDLAVGLLLGSLIRQPYANSNYIYIDELDTHADYRRRGIARALMQEAFRIGKEMGAQELWLGTEPDNTASNGLYASLKPSETEECIGYTYEL
jgi:aminoglycoside 6'-N-acetyltransferase I